MNTMPKLTTEQLTEYLRGIAKERGFDDTRTGRLTALVAGDGDLTITRADLREILEPIVEHPLARHADFARKLDEYNKMYVGLQTWKAGAEKTVADAEAEVQKYKTEVERLRAQIGDPDDVHDRGDGTGVTKEGKVVSMEDVNKLVASERDQIQQRMSQEFLGYQLDADRITREHFERFGALPNMGELLKRIAEAQKDPINPRKLDLDEAYNEIHGDKVKQYEAKKEEERIEKLVKERVRQQTSRAGSTSGANTTEDGVLFSGGKIRGTIGTDPNPPAPLDENAALAAFEADFNAELVAANATGSA
jgi:hypothetical protein